MRREKENEPRQIDLYTCFEISQPRKDVIVKPSVQCMQKTMLYMPMLDIFRLEISRSSLRPTLQIGFFANKPKKRAHILFANRP
uniref:Uncharacterized protein n=1 Tax=Romanomermis culicivorax TaxID=13658 RepID=A0A915J4R9_ROMCU